MLERKITDLLIMQQELNKCRMIYQTMYLFALISLGVFVLWGEITNNWLLGMIVGIGTTVILVFVGSSVNDRAGRIVEEITKDYGELREKLYVHN